ncbi:uncharacterized protein BP5553_03312 [Venustampulla echinocandica]|uniref:Uncharacterized protein n=1 Tax=Venustampulla echinocandica TaxID=2656787 RepID=A0A370TTW3_9HELO|nr:uncharacterized protein BP5553_03312 [Venustampulla echinocandica]RDL38972.1 hypothetical protein BP5553_03312 [Venustampulla echinocandica]
MAGDIPQPGTQKPKVNNSIPSILGHSSPDNMAAVPFAPAPASLGNRKRKADEYPAGESGTQSYDPHYPQYSPRKRSSGPIVPEPLILDPPASSPALSAPQLSLPDIPEVITNESLDALLASLLPPLLPPAPSSMLSVPQLPLLDIPLGGFPSFVEPEEDITNKTVDALLASPLPPVPSLALPSSQLPLSDIPLGGFSSFVEPQVDSTDEFHLPPLLPPLPPSPLLRPVPSDLSVPQPLLPCLPLGAFESSLQSQEEEVPLKVITSVLHLGEEADPLEGCVAPAQLPEEAASAGESTSFIQPHEGEVYVESFEVFPQPQEEEEVPSTPPTPEYPQGQPDAATGAFTAVFRSVVDPAIIVAQIEDIVRRTTAAFAGWLTYHKNCHSVEVFKAGRLAEGGMEWIFDCELYLEDEFVMDTRCDFSANSKI